MLKSIFRLLRIKQWIKNVFVLAPLLFSLQFTQIDDVVASLKVFGLFCLASSFIYIINDWKDAKYDRLHPRKKHRPLACGAVSFITAAEILTILLVLIVIACYNLENYKAVGSIWIYIGLNLLYTFGLKHFAIIDVLIIALGFILRVYAGAYAIGCPVSSFIFMTTLFLSLFLGFCKRYGEIIAKQQKTRWNLREYSPQLLDVYVGITATLTIMSYALYTLEGRTISSLSSNRLVYSLFFVVYGILRYVYLLHIRENVDDPTENLYRDKTLMLTCVLFVLYWIALYLKII